MLAALIILLQTNFPSLIVDARYKTVLIRDGNSMNTLGGGRIMSKKHKEQWLNLMNSGQIVKTQSTNNYALDYQGYKLNLMLKSDDKNRLILQQLDLQNEFNKTTIMIDDIEKNGSYFVYLTPKDIKLKYSVNSSLNRPWHIRHLAHN